jgi:flagellar capping protein FliD
MAINHNSKTTSVRCNGISKKQRDAIWEYHRSKGGTINNTNDLIRWWINECTQGILAFKIPK